MFQGEMSYKQSKYGQLIDRFSDGGYKICEVIFNHDDNLPQNIIACINRACKRYNRPHIVAVNRDDKIYIINRLKG